MEKQNAENQVSVYEMVLAEAWKTVRDSFQSNTVGTTVNDWNAYQCLCTQGGLNFLLNWVMWIIRFYPHNWKDTRVGAGTHAVGILPSFFLFSADIHNISISLTPPQYFRQPESSQLKYRGIFCKNTM